jgi:hypothetical protein
MAEVQTTTVWDEVLDFLTSSPTLEQIANIQASEALTERAHYLMEQNRSGVLSPEEKAEVEQLSQLNHFMIMLKATARRKLKQNDTHS